MNAIVCGDRNYTNKEFVRYVLTAYRAEIQTIIQGECRGADTFAREIAQELQIPVRAFEVTKEDWNRLGRAAGPIRNKAMLDAALASGSAVVIAFHDDIENSKGTYNMITLALNANVRVLLCSNQTVKVYNGREKA